MRELPQKLRLQAHQQASKPLRGRIRPWPESPALEWKQALRTLMQQAQPQLQQRPGKQGPLLGYRLMVLLNQSSRPLTAIIRSRAQAWMM